MKEIINDLKSGSKLQGIPLNLHGAMIVESYPSGDEEIVNDSEVSRLSKLLWDTREDTRVNNPTPADAVRMAIQHNGRPVILIDMGDNIGGGSTGDSSFLLEEHDQLLGIKSTNIGDEGREHQIQCGSGNNPNRV